MLLFYYGTDTGRLRQAVDALTVRYRTKHAGNSNLFLLDVSDENDRTELERTLKNLSFFREPMFIAARNVFSEKTASSLVKDLFSDDLLIRDRDLVLLVYEYGDAPSLSKDNKRLFTSLMEQAHEHKEFLPLTGAKHTAWIQAFCKERECTLAPQDATHLVNLVGEDTWTLMTELAKLCAWQRSGRIPREAIGRLAVPALLQASAFGLTDALTAGNKRRALKELEQHLAQGAKPHSLFAVYAFTIRNILTIKDLSERGLAPARIAKQAGIHPFVVSKNFPAAKRFDTQRLLNAYDWLSRADKATKNGQWDPVDALYDFILTVM